jgi:hypothetical protein
LQGRDQGRSLHWHARAQQPRLAPRELGDLAGTRTHHEQVLEISQASSLA